MVLCVVGKNKALHVVDSSFNTGDVISVVDPSFGFTRLYRPSPDEIQEVRQASGASMIDCAFALGMAQGSIKQAIKYLGEA